MKIKNLIYKNIISYEKKIVKVNDKNKNKLMKKNIARLLTINKNINL